MHSSLRAFGFTESDRPYVKAFEDWAKDSGWSRKQIEAAFGWYKDRFNPSANPAQNWNDFVQYSEHKGIPSKDVEGAGDWYEAVHMHGPELYHARQPDPADDQKRLDDIQRMIERDPDAYFGNPELEREHFDLLERLSGEGGQPETLKGPTSGRKAQLEAMIKDANSDYYVGVNAKALQAEHLQLLETESGERDSVPAAPLNTGVTSNGGSGEGV